MCVFIRGQGYCQFKCKYIWENFVQNKIIYLEAAILRTYCKIWATVQQLKVGFFLNL